MAKKKIEWPDTFCLKMEGQKYKLHNVLGNVAFYTAEKYQVFPALEIVNSPEIDNQKRKDDRNTKWNEKATKEQNLTAENSARKSRHNGGI